MWGPAGGVEEGGGGTSSGGARGEEMRVRESRLRGRVHKSADAFFAECRISFAECHTIQHLAKN